MQKDLNNFSEIISINISVYELNQMGHVRAKQGIRL